MIKNYYLIFLPFFCAAQNLVRNPDFESLKFCPKGIGQFQNNVVDWSLPNSGTSDVFSECGLGEAAVPSNVFGFQNAKSGRAYAGFYAYVSAGAREYLQGALLRPLEAGKKYRIAFWVSLSEISDYAVDGFGVIFSENEIKARSGGVLTPSEAKKANPGIHQIIGVGDGNFLSDKANWTLVEATFEAMGSERFLSIGNFRSKDATSKKLIQKQTTSTSYYYIDLVSVTEFSSEPEIGLQPDKTYTLPISFDFDSAQITPEAEAKLQEIIDYLNTHPKTYLKLSGHTDDVGSEEYNQKISLKRVRSVADYLLSKNVESERVQTLGFGESQPIDDNATEAGRSRNRRVEFILVE